MKPSRYGRVLVLLSAFLLSVPCPIEAQTITFDGCVDSRGIPVASVRQPGLGDVAKSTLDPKGRPVIVYDPVVLSWFHPQTRLFWYAHECAHHALGHTL